MKTTKMLAILVLALGLFVSPVELAGAAPMGTAFTYQGRLIEANKPADGLYDLQCKLYDANVGGTQKGSTIDVNELDVIDGLFTVLLDFGSGVFDGNTVWLEIGVRAGELKDPNAYTTLSPRQEITPAPYALQTRGLFVDSALNVGIGTTGPISKLEVMSTEDYHGIRSTVPYIAVYGHRTGTSGTWPGVHGECDSLSNNASGVRGVINSMSPGTNSAGIRGINNGTGDKGAGVYGWQAGDGYGVYGDTAGNGIGVYGIHSSSTGQEPGVKGETKSTSMESSGVFGLASATTGITYGVRGQSASNSGDGLVGRATATSGYTTGAAGQSDSTSGIGVSGWASNGTGSTYGGYFQAASADGTGVFAFHDSGSGTAPALMARNDSASANAYAVHGRLNNTSPARYPPVSVERTSAPVALELGSGGHTTATAGVSMARPQAVLERVSLGLVRDMTFTQRVPGLIMAPLPLSAGKATSAQSMSRSIRLCGYAGYISIGTPSTVEATMLA